MHTDTGDGVYKSVITLKFETKSILLWSRNERVPPPLYRGCILSPRNEADTLVV